MSGKIIIKFDNGIDEIQALSNVLRVIQEGRVSKTSKGVKHFCWSTRFCNGICVFVGVKKKNQTSDSFRVSLDR